MSRLALGALASALILVTPGIVQGAELPKQVEVNLEGIDVTSTPGAGQALRRIHRAAEAVCGMRNGVQPYGERRQARACMDEAVSDAVDALDEPMATARYRGARNYAQRGERS
jgi:UrcA family protein